MKIIALFMVAAGSAALAAESTQPAVKVSFYDHYAAALKTYVDGGGMVNYKGLKAKPEKLNAFIAALGELARGTYDEWDDSEKIAFWINAYNALTLQAIIDHYPIKASYLRSFIYPKNSIRQISGVWDKRTSRVMGRKMTLDQIEHEVLRKKFDEPRIHVALVCAAMGCPPLRNEPYLGEKLDQQLDDQAKRFLRNPKKFRIDRPAGAVHVSSIFKWFGGDSIKTYGTDKDFADHRQTERAVLNLIRKYLDEKDRAYLLDGTYRIKYLDYDWTLNERAE